MNVGMIILVAAALLVYLGVAQRVLDRLRLSDRAALIFIAAIIVGGLLPDIPLTDNVSVNIGGGIIPFVLAGYLFSRAGTAKEKVRAVVAMFVTALVVYAATKILPVEPTYNYFLDPVYIFAVIAGVTGYLAGRSRRSAFIAGSMGLLLVDIFSRIEIALVGGSGSLSIGGAGVFDGIILGGILALLIAEVIGETRESLQGGPDYDREPELIAGLSSPKKQDDENAHKERREE